MLKEYQMNKEQAIAYVKENYHNDQIQLSPIAGYLFKNQGFHYELFAESERSYGPLDGIIKDGEFYLIGHNLATVGQLDLDPKLEGAMFRLIIGKMNELIEAIPKEEIPEHITIDDDDIPF